MGECVEKFLGDKL